MQSLDTSTWSLSLLSIFSCCVFLQAAKYTYKTGEDGTQIAFDSGKRAFDLTHTSATTVNFPSSTFSVGLSRLGRGIRLAPRSGSLNGFLPDRL